MQQPQQLISLFNQLVERIENNLGDDINALAIAGEFGYRLGIFNVYLKA